MFNGAKQKLKKETVMTADKIKESLCYYDKRNPDYIESDRILSKDTFCYCDNCFRGKHQLANELLRVKEELSTLHSYMFSKYEENKNNLG